MRTTNRHLGRGATFAVLALAVGAWLPAAAAPDKTGPAKPRATRSALPASVRHTLPFISDDYDRAVAEARSRQVPIFVESWAPW